MTSETEFDTKLTFVEGRQTEVSHSHAYMSHGIYFCLRYRVS